MPLLKCLLLATAIALPSAVHAQPKAPDGNKTPVSEGVDPPQLVIELPAKPSTLVSEGGPALTRITTEIKDYADMILRDYEIPDQSVRREFLTLQLGAAMVENRWDDAISLCGKLQAAQDKPSAKATTCLITGSYVRAAKAVGETSPQFGDRFERELRDATAKLDWAVTQDEIQELRGEFQLMTRDLIIGSVQSLDANAAAENNKVGVGLAGDIVGAWQTLAEVVPLKDRIFAVFDERVKSNATEKVDLWTSRTISLKPAQVAAPVIIAMWDSGTDPKVFPGQVWTNLKEKPNGADDDGNGFIDDIHGIAFDPDYRPSRGTLRPMEAGDLTDITGKLKLTKGSLDLQASIDSPEADAFRAKIAGMKADQVMPFSLQDARLSIYLHGTTTAYVCSIGNPGARLLTARFDERVAAVPEPIDEKVAAAMAVYAATSVEYFKQHGVRVVNMSWRVTEPQIDGSLMSVDPDPVKRKTRARAIFDTINTALEAAFKSAPDILFIAGAGNEDEDVDFVRSFPAGINLPNVMTVGAVDVALQPVNFTSYGKSIDVYANGFEVPTKVPGGMALNISGTSIAAPQVTNLAAKLFAVHPKLSATAVRNIIEQTATLSADRKLKVIDPRAAMAAAK